MTPDPLVGRRFGSYLVERPLGAGGMGAVYQAVQPEIGKRVAIKFLAPELAGDRELVQRFFAEARAVNLIQHENIVDIFDFRVIEGHSYFVMELLPGCSLAALLAREPQLPVARAVAVAVQVSAAIATAHAHQIVHRDLKPDNIFLTTRAGYEDFVKVLDFGIAKLTRPDALLPQTLRGVIMGTPGYMSPEQGNGEAVDARTDVYALGVMLYRMLAGHTPFDGRAYDEILKAQLQNRPAPLERVRGDLPAGLGALVHEMIQRDPARRPQRMREVQERLVTLLRTLQPTRPGRIQPVPINLEGGWRSVPPTRVPVRGRLTNRTLGRVIIAGAGLASAALAGWLWWRPGPPSAPPLAPVASPVIAPAPAPPIDPSFAIFLETSPPDVEVWGGELRLGATPVQLTLAHEQTLRLHKAGYRDQLIDATRGTGQLVVPMARVPAVARPHPRPAAGPPPSSGTGLGLND
jgi:serine/threonine-protein kinase